MNSLRDRFDLNVALSPRSESASSESIHHDDSDGSSVENSGGSESSSGPVVLDQPAFDRPLFGDELIELSKEHKIYGHIASRLLFCLGPLLRDRCRLVSIHMNNFRSLNGWAKFRAFQMYAEAAKRRNGGCETVKYAWCAVGREEITDIVNYGFGEPRDDGFYGRGLYLAPENAPLECLEESVADGDELRFLLLCRVILGKSEAVPLRSYQSHPSSIEFDSGVDNLSSPKRYIVWSTHMNTHVLPAFVVCLRAPASLQGFIPVPDSSRRSRRPSSPWIPFPVLISVISKFLDPYSMRIVLKHYKDHKERKISRYELIRELRQITGDEILIKIIKSFRQKELL